MRIGRIVHGSLVDFPGQVASTIFTSGCNFRCPFCFNSPLLFDHEKIDTDQVIKEIDERKRLITAVVVSGGEPTLQKQSLIDFLRKTKDSGFLTKLDTNGSNPDLLYEIEKLGIVDYIAMDLKTSLESYYDLVEPTREFSGLDLSITISESIDIVKIFPDYEFRTTLVPGFINTEILAELLDIVSPAKRYTIQNYEPKESVLNPQKIKGLFVPTELDEFRKILELAKGIEIKSINF